MKTVLLSVPVFLAYVILAAHFLRFGNIVPLLFCMSIPGLLFVRRWWSKLFLQIGLGGGAVVWILTTLTLVMSRQQSAQPWLRMAIILGSVALFNLVAAGLLQTPTMRRWFTRPNVSAEAETPAADAKPTGVAQG